MKKYLLTLLLSILIIQPSYAWSFQPNALDSEEKAVKKVLDLQVKYANRNNFDKFISTFDSSYVNSDGFDLEVYSKLVKDIWTSYRNVKYGMKFKNIDVKGDTATVEVLETSYAELPVTHVYHGELKSESNSIYSLKKINGKWKVVSDSVLDEETSMLYGEAKDLQYKLTVPNKIAPDTEYTATLELTPPKETIVVASLASDKVEYPQKPAEEVFRALPEDNILERLFTSNNENLNEYIVASIGLTKSSVENMNIKLSLVGFGYAIRRVNVVKECNVAQEGTDKKDVKDQ